MPGQEPAVQLQETELAAVDEANCGTGWPAGTKRAATPISAIGQRKVKLVQVVLMISCTVIPLAALAFTVTAEQVSAASVYELDTPVRSKRSYSDSFM